MTLAAAAMPSGAVAALSAAGAPGPRQQLGQLTVRRLRDAGKRLGS